MRKIYIYILMLSIVLLVGCNNQKADVSNLTNEGQKLNADLISDTKELSSDEVVEIKDKMFIQQINDIYLNYDDYKDKVIKLEGIYEKINYEDKTYHTIYRNGPNCCGDDGQVGFQFNYDGDMPKPNDWIKVSGTIQVEKNSYGLEEVVLNLTNLEVSSIRGEEYVAN